MARKGRSKASPPLSTKPGPAWTHKTTRKCVYTEEDLCKALEACKISNSERISVTEAAKVYGVPKSTLSGRINGRKCHKEAHINQQILTPLQEKVLVLLCQSRGWRGEPIGFVELQQIVKSIGGQAPGARWIHSFTQ